MGGRVICGVGDIEGVTHKWLWREMNTLVGDVVLEHLVHKNNSDSINSIKSLWLQQTEHVNKWLNKSLNESSEIPIKNKNFK